MKLEKILQLELPIICCENEEQSKKLLEKLDKLGYAWASGRKLNQINFSKENYSIYYIIRKQGVTYSNRKPNSYYTHFVDIDDFKKQENHEKDVCDYKNVFVLPKEKFNTNYKVFFLGEWLSKSKNMLIINKEKKYVLLKFNGKEYRVDCHEEDKFNWEIGFGLALSKAVGKLCKWEKTREFYRDKNRKLNYKEYAKWCIIEYFNNDVIAFNRLKKAVEEINEYGKVDL